MRGIVFAVALAFGLGAGAATAQETVLGGDGANAAPAADAAAPPASAAPAWASRCLSDRRQGNVDCSVSQRVINQGGQLIGAVTVRATPGGKPTILATLPLGLAIPGGVGVDVDGAQTQKLELQTCDRNGCYASGTLADALLAAMQKGKKLDVTFQSLNRQGVTLPLTLAGFTAAYQNIK